MIKVKKGDMIWDSKGAYQVVNIDETLDIINLRQMVYMHDGVYKPISLKQKLIRSNELARFQHI